MLGSLGWTWTDAGLVWSVGSWIVEAEVGLLQCWSTGSGRGTPLQKNKKEGGSARASPVAAPMPKLVLS